jgi:hypothetical protein
MRAKSKNGGHGGAVRRHRSVVASAFTLLLSTAGALGFSGSANASTMNQIPVPPTTVCPVGTTPILSGPYEGFCRMADGTIFNPTTKEILYSPPPKLPIQPPPLPGTAPPPAPPSTPGSDTGTPPSTGGVSNSTRGPTHKISMSVINSHSYGTPYGMYFGNFGGGQTFFSPDGLSEYETYRSVYYLSAFGRPVTSDVSTTVIDATRVTPVSTKVPNAPDEVWLLLPFGLVLLTMVTYLVLEPDADRLRL